MKGDCTMKGGCTIKVVYPICCGVDVHKTFLVATIITSQRLTPHYSNIKQAAKLLISVGLIKAHDFLFCN